MSMWVKVQILGWGSYGTVFLAIPINPNSTLSPIAIKSALIPCARSLVKERRILQDLLHCPGIIQCFGEDLSIEFCKSLYKGVYNLLLEYAPGGTLSQLINDNGGMLPEPDVQRYTRMILEGLHCIHKRGYVHCDLKPCNILVCYSQDGMNHLKITDFGLAKEPGEYEYFWDSWVHRFRGTPLYMSPESVALGEIEAPLDIWSLGCIVVYMVTGKPIWSSQLDEAGLMFAIEKQEPKLPQNMSDKGIDFLRRCFLRDPSERWTAEMLLNHPFIVEVEGSSTSLPDEIGPVLPSPRSPFDHAQQQFSLPPPGWCSFSNTSLPSSPSSPPPGWCSFSNTSLPFCCSGLPSSPSSPPPGWCSFSSSGSPSLPSAHSTNLGCGVAIQAVAGIL